MPEKTRLIIAEPCHQPWNEMQPQSDGRFCGSCQKTVVDFTMMSDQEVLTWLSGAGRSVCGRFMEDQLNRDMTMSPSRHKHRWTLWQYLLAGLLVSSEVSAQGKVSQPPLTQSDDTLSRNDYRVGKMGAGLATPSLIRLLIVDEESGMPLPFATIAGGKEHFIADSAGRCNIPASSARRIYKWKISSTGYNTKTVTIDDSRAGEQVHIISLVRNAGQTLKDAIVTAYGNDKCRTLTGYTTSVTTGEVVISRSRTNLLLNIVKDTLEFFGVVKQPLYVYPNPVARGGAMTLSVRTGRPGNYLVQLFSSTGALVESMRIEGVDGPRTELLNFPASLAAGVYFVTLSHELTGKVYTQKVEVM